MEDPVIQDAHAGEAVFDWNSTSSEISCLSSLFTTSTSACSRGVLVSAPCPAGDACRFCPGLKQLRRRDARPVREGLP
jgi:hypothetical protein